MYIPSLHRFSDPAAMLALVDAQPLGAWVCTGAGGLLANHVPFLLGRHRGACGTLVGHVARANPVWRQFDAGLPSVVMFQWPQAYISPAWYPGHATHGRVVPTWNYAVVHAHGMARAVQDRDWLLQMLRRLTSRHEARQPQPWRVADVPVDALDQMLRAIVGVEITIDRIEGRCKASQDDDLPDRLGTVRGLRADSQPGAAGVADLVQRAIDRGPGRPA